MTRIVADPAPGLAAERARMRCTRRQGKLAIGETMWAQVEAMAADPDMPWGLRVAVHDTTEWHRTSEDMAALIWAMDMTEAEADDLFRQAMAIE